MLCRFFRFLISEAADSEQGMGPWTRRHVASCPDCRQFHRSCRLLANRLKAEAARLAGPSSRPTGMPYPQKRAGRPLWRGLAAAACVALTVRAGLVLVQRRAEPPAPPAPQTLAVTIPAMDWATAWAHVLEGPLTTEIESLSRDAQSGVRFLVSCLDVLPVHRADALAGEPIAEPWETVLRW